MSRKRTLTTRKFSTILRSITLPVVVGALAWQAAPNVSRLVSSYLESPESQFLRARLSRESEVDAESLLCNGESVATALRNATYISDDLAPAADYFDSVRFRLNDQVMMSSLNGGPKPSVKHKVKRGDTFSHVWSAHGSSTVLGMKAEKACREAKLGECGLRCGEELEISFGADGGIERLSKQLSDGSTLILSSSEFNESGYNVDLLRAVLRESERTATGTISSSFAEAALQVGMPYSVVDDLVDLFSDRIDFRKDLQPGDAFSVIYNEKNINDGEIIQAGDVHAASLTINGKMRSVIRHVGKDGKPRYFDENGKILGDYFLRYPVAFTRISSVFSTSRFHPVLKKSRPHNGVDFAAPAGTPVRTVADGVVVKAGYNSGAGNMVKIKHDNKYTTEYFHLSKIAGGIRCGSRVARGEVIGNVGSTGLSTAPHLHFGFYENDRYIDPLKIDLPELVNDKERIPQGYLTATLQTLKRQLETIKLAAKSSEESKV